MLTTIIIIIIYMTGKNHEIYIGIRKYYRKSSLCKFGTKFRQLQRKEEDGRSMK
jgi:hypothetical protein